MISAWQYKYSLLIEESGACDLEIFYFTDAALTTSAEEAFIYKKNFHGPPIQVGEGFKNKMRGVKNTIMIQILVCYPKNLLS